MASTHAAMRRLVPGLLAMFALAGCFSGPPRGATLWVRNEAHQSVTVTVRQPGALLPGIIGPADYRHVVPPWQPGWCAGDWIQVLPGSQAIITGPGVTTWTGPVISAANLYTATNLLVRSDGTIVDLVSRPQENYPCFGYPEGTPPFPSPPG